MRVQRWIVGVIVSVLSGACTQVNPVPTVPPTTIAQAPTETQPPVRVSTFTPTPTPSPLPTDTATPTPTATFTPSKTLTPTATLTPSATFTPLPAEGSRGERDLSVRVDRIREAESLNGRTPPAPGRTYLVFDATVHNNGDQRRCLYDGDFRVRYSAGENDDQTTLPNLNGSADRLKEVDSAYAMRDYPKPNQFQYNVRGLDFCTDPNSFRETMLVYAAPEDWAQMVLLFGEKEPVPISMCLARSNAVENGFRSVFFTTRCRFEATFEQISEAYDPTGFKYAVEEPVMNCDSDNPTTASWGASQPQLPTAAIEVKNSWVDVLNVLLPTELALQTPIGRISLQRRVELHHQLTAGETWITVNVSLSKTVPGRTSAKYRFLWREYTVKGVISLNMLAEDGSYTIARSRIPYEITGQIRVSVETVYEQACGTATP